MMNESTTNLKMSVIGIGNAGNQVAMAAAAKGHNVFAINTSQRIWMIAFSISLSRVITLVMVVALARTATMPWLF